MEEKKTKNQPVPTDFDKVLKEYEPLLDVKLKLSARLGGSILKIKDLLNLDLDSILQLDRLAGDSADILINDVPVARGEVIVIGQSFGVRITEILSSLKR
jgi:flagellar motor switch protein FliN